ncbi:MAG TPA: HEAT repeat domain-containing protein, partial [Desulfatiglandales bacterium]|nr:HEAT repeat domain-containing protein [Desulfatiglandales bacterium]
MLQQKHRFFSVILEYTVITLPFLLLLQPIPYAHADKIHKLIQALNEPGQSCEAAKALAELKASQAVEPLIDTVKHNNDRQIRRCAAEALAKIGDDRAVDMLISALKDEDHIIASRSAYALGWIGDKRAVKPLLHALTELNIPCPAAEALGKIKDPATVNPLIEALKHEDTGVRGCAVIALGMIGDTRACQPLVKVFMQDSDPGTQYRARRALKMIGCSFKEHAQEYGIEDDLCNMGQRMIDFMSSNMEKYPDQKSFSRSVECKDFFSELMSEQKLLSSTDLEVRNKSFRVFFLVSDWASSVDRLRELKRSSDKNKE